MLEGSPQGSANSCCSPAVSTVSLEIAPVASRSEAARHPIPAKLGWLRRIPFQFCGSTGVLQLKGI